MRGVSMGGFEAAKAGLESGELAGSNVKCFTRYSGWCVRILWRLHTCFTPLLCTDELQARQLGGCAGAGAQVSWLGSAKRASGSLPQLPAASCCSRGRMERPCGIRYAAGGLTPALVSSSLLQQEITSFCTCVSHIHVWRIVYRRSS
jgi:hypothetical protein